MKTYTLTALPYKSREFYHWADIFESLSVSEFDVIAPHVRFPFPVTQAMRQVARAFALARLKTIDPNEFRVLPVSPVPIEHDFLEGVDELTPFPQKAGIMFTAAFSRLEALGCAEAVYEWGSGINTRRSSQQDRATDECYSALRKWFYLELKKTDGDTLSATVDQDKLQRLLDHEAVSSLNFNPFKVALDLPASTKAALLAIFLHYELDQVELKARIEAIQIQYSHDPWTVFLNGYFPVLSLFRIFTTFRYRAEAWHQVRARLSLAESIEMGYWLLDVL